MDESSDSYLTRSDVVWTELLSKKVDMSELRAYIVLRNSRLSSEDKKRVIVEAGAERGDALAMSKVTAAIRMLGSNFFLDLTGQKRDKGLKTYDHTAFHVEDQPDPEEAMWVQEDGGLDDQTLEILAAEDDEDAAMILQFEDAVSELVQNDQELCAYFSAYQDARKRLSEKVRFRGFWAVKRGEKGSGEKGKVKGKGKASLARRIANSYCRVCLQKGHWKDECPQRKTADGASGSSNNVMPTSFVTTDVPEAMQNMPTAQVTKHEQKCQQFCIFGVITGNQRHHQGPRLSLFKKQNSGTVPALRSRPNSEPNARDSAKVPVADDVKVEHISEECASLFASSGTIGVVDLGASQTVMCDRQVPELLCNLPEAVRQQVKHQPCHLVFRFGNHQTLVSRHALVLPLESQTFRIAVVPGNTPFLISSAFLKGIKAVIDTDLETLWSKSLGRHLNIQRSHKNLFLMDIAQLWENQSTSQEPSSFVAEAVQNPNNSPTVKTHEPFAREDDTHNQVNRSTGSDFQVPVRSEDVQNLSVDVHSRSQATQGLKSESSVSDISHVAGLQVVPVSRGVRGGQPDGKDGSDSTDVLGRAEQRDHPVWEGQSGSAISTGLPGHQMDRMVCRSVREVDQGSPCQIHHVRREETGSGDRDVQGQGKGQETSHQDVREEDDQRRDSRSSEGDGIRSLVMGGHQGRTVRSGELSLGASWNARADRSCGPASRGTSRTEQPSDSDGKCPAGSAAPCQESFHAATTVKTDPQVDQDTNMDFEFITQEGKNNSFQKIISQQVKQFTKELQRVVQDVGRMGRRLDLLEVMCDGQSELTRQVIAAGGRAMRHSLEHGDLNTVEGRRKLFEIMVQRNPKNLWYSPVCAPWCSWNQFNSQRSTNMYEHVFHQRLTHLWQISLGIVMSRFQKSQGNHYHHEQPAGSSQLKVPGAQEIPEQTLRCCFDLCNVGHLQDPQNGKLIRKRLVVQSTSEELYRNLNGKYCKGDHDHQNIAGSTTVNGTTMLRSKFTEWYPRKFAKQIARILLYQQLKSQDTFAGEVDEHPTKRRRLTEKMGPTEIQLRFPSIDWQTAMKLADQVAKRVGTLVIDSGPLIQQVRALCPDHKVHHVVLCRGIDRHMGPNCKLPKGEAPVRKMVCIRRKHEDVHVEDEWEPWEKLTFKGLRRKHIAARIGMVIFARPKPRESGSASADAPISDHPPPSREDSGRTKKARVETDDAHSLPSPFIPETSTTPEDSTQPPPIVTRDQTDQEPEEPLRDRQVIDLVADQHGPKFQQLARDERAWLLKIHRNMGHPGAAKLVEFCRQLRCPERILHAIPDLKCSTCIETMQPKVARPSTIHDQCDFGDVISMDGITWTNSKGQQFYFYHFVDQSTTYQTAICVPHASAENAATALLQGWLQWAGPPKLLCIDAGTDLNSEQFQNFLQRHSICSRTCATDAHWQNARAERHGGILQTILQKMDQEENIEDSLQMSMALMHATATKNQWSRYRGFPPELLVFGKGIRVAGSVISDDSRAAHAAALNSLSEGQRFRQDLALRERARKAFAQVDNEQSLRRAIVSRSCPSRGNYCQGDWVMMWKKRGEADGVWEGPLQVIVQEQSRVVWVTRMNKLYRVAPEHLRPLSAVEEWRQQQQPTAPTDLNQSIRPPHGGTQFQNLRDQPSEATTQNEVAQRSTESMPSAGNVPARDVRANSNATDPEVEPDVTNPEVPQGEPEVNSETSHPNTMIHNPTIPENNPDTIATDPAQIPIPHSDDDELFTEDFTQNWIDYCDCFTLLEDTAWKFEVDISHHDIQQWRAESEPGEMAFLVSAAKRQRSEVKMTQLTHEERQMFKEAKNKEIDSWIATETVAKVLRHQIPAENIMRCRWILTWKPVDQPKAGEQKHTPKARLVVLGYEDPLVHEIPRDSPTMSKLSRMLILQTAASRGWNIESFDIKTAFLRGQEQGNRTLGLEPNEELRERLKMHPQEVLKLLKGAYGRVDAPYLWFMELKRGLEALSFQASPFDPCTFVLTCPQTGKTEGLVGVHVDDGLCCGSALFQDKLKKLAQQFPFGAHKKNNFTFTGLSIEQHADYSITVHQQQYIKDIHPITISKDRRNNPEQVVTEAERQSLRAIVGSLQYAAVNSRPDLCSRLGWLQSRVNSAKVETLIEANRVLHEAKQHSEVGLKIQALPMDQVRFVAFSDASFSSAKNPDSHQGMLIMACHSDLGQNKTGIVNPIMWHSKKIQKVAVSTLSAEAMSLANAVDILSWVRLYWGWMHNTKLPWKKADQALLQLPPAFAALPPPDDPNEDFSPPENTMDLLKTLPKNCESIITTDCKSLYDLISRTAPPSCQEFRTQLQAKLIKEHLGFGIQIRWVPSGAQVADALTKVMDNTMIRECLRLGKYSLRDEAETLKARSDSRARLQWLREQADPHVKGSEE